MLKISPRTEREILTAKLDYRNACSCVARATRLGLQGMLNRATVDRDNAEKRFLKLILPYARLSGEFSYEMLALHGTDGTNALNDIRAAMDRCDVDYMKGYLYTLEFDKPIEKLIK